MEFPDPVIEVAVEPKTKGDQEKMAIALGRLAQEDPSFRVTSDPESGYRTLGWTEAIPEGSFRTWYWVRTTLEFLGQLVSGKSSAKDVGCPILIGQLSGRAARAGIWTFLSFMGIISVNLAILNLLPVPVLDGGHLTFLAFEAVRGKALSVEQRIRLTQVGLVLIVGLMVWVITNDVLRLL